MPKRKIHIGTSGWHYKHWKGTFYPEGTRDDEQFVYYCQHFKTVEVNNSFYKLPESSTFTAWRKAAPRAFLFAVKASRFITHMKKLNMNRTELHRFFSRVDKLEGKLGPILFQLPPRWKLNLQRLADFLSVLPAGYRYAFEFRNADWYLEEVYALLKKYNVSFCIYELDKHLSPLVVTADFVYIRLHGPGNKYQGSYSRQALKKWADYCKKCIKEGRDVYLYFDNDQEGYAAFNALAIRDIIG